MASFAKHIAFVFLLVLCFSNVHIQARESKFFSKIFHLGSKIVPDLQEPIAAPTPTPALAPIPAIEPAAAPEVAPVPEIEPASAPGPASFESQDPYYGLYGRASDMSESVTTSNTPTTTNNFENELLAEELEDEKYKSGYEKNNYNDKVYTTSNYDNNNGYSLNNNNGYTTSNYNNNGYSLSSSNNNNGYSSSSYKTNGHSYNNNNVYANERQGMSDTRSMEGGKYFYDVKNENYYHTGYESGKETTKNEAYYGYTENSNEFNSMEEFSNKEDEYQESQEEYVP